MTDFGGYRAMLVDFGVDPRVVDTMSLSQLLDMMMSLEKRRGKSDVPSAEERGDKFNEFLGFVAADPAVRIH